MYSMSIKKNKDSIQSDNVDFAIVFNNDYYFKFQLMQL